MKDNNLDGVISKKPKKNISKFEKFCTYAGSVSVLLSLIFIFTSARREFFCLLSVFWAVVAVIAVFKYKSATNKATYITIAILLLLFAGWVAPTSAKSETAKSSDANKTESVKKDEPKTTTKTITEMSPIPFASTTQDDATLAKGQTKTITAGVDGEKTTTYEVTYDANGAEISRKVVKEETTKQPVDEVIANGTYVAPAKTTTTTQTPTTTTTTPSTQTSPETGTNTLVSGYCIDGLYVTGNPSARGRANACYGHGGWRDY